MDNDNNSVKNKIQNKNILKTPIFKKINKINLIIISDYNKGIFKNNTQDILKIANKNKIPVLVDPKTDDISKYSNCLLISPNLKELNKLVSEYKDNDIFLKKYVRRSKKIK